MPVVEERRRHDAFQPAKAAVDVGVHQQTLEALEGEVADDRGSGEAEREDR
jgi:DNA-binding XRE family transcriptional regulator